MVSVRWLDYSLDPIAPVESNADVLKRDLLPTVSPAQCGVRRLNARLGPGPLGGLQNPSH